MFDRCLELGADVLVVKKDKIKKINKFLEIAKKMGYNKIIDNNLGIVLKFPVKTKFATKVSYDGLAIGKYSSNISFIFPQFEIGKSLIIDDYDEKELSKYKVIYLSGFQYKNRARAENIIKRLSTKNVKFLIDLTGVESDIYSSRATFLNVIAQPVLFNNSYPMLSIGKDNFSTPKFSKDNRNWNTIYIENLDKVTGKISFENQEMNFLGTKINSNINFIGFNIPYFALKTKDEKCIQILSNITGLKPYDTPKRKIVKIDQRQKGNVFEYLANEKNVILSVAALDAYKSITGEYEEKHNLVFMKSKHLKYEVTYPYVKKGILITIGAIFVGIGLYLFLFNKQLFKLDLLKVKKE
jgi:uncharacterized membrane protein